MEYRYARYSSLLNKITNKDRLFLGDYTLDPYQNCEFGCKYCDSALDKAIYIKTNAIQLLKKELKNMNKNGTIIIGSVADPYQKAEKKYETTRSLLKIIQKHNFPCHILTKSNLVLRDIDILSKMDMCLVTLSITTLDKSISDVFERKVPSPVERLQTIKKLSERNLKAGIAVIPVLPYIVEKELNTIVKLAKEHKAQYFLYKCLELKGDQKNIFMRTLQEYFPDIVENYLKMYKDSYMSDNNYVSKINDSINTLCAKYKLKNRI